MFSSLKIVAASVAVANAITIKGDALPVAIIYCEKNNSILEPIETEQDNSIITANGPVIAYAEDADGVITTHIGVSETAIVIDEKDKEGRPIIALNGHFFVIDNSKRITEDLFDHHGHANKNGAKKAMPQWKYKSGSQCHVYTFCRYSSDANRGAVDFPFTVGDKDTKNYNQEFVTDEDDKEGSWWYECSTPAP